MHLAKRILAAVSLATLAVSCSGGAPSEPAEKGTDIDTGSEWGKFLDGFLTGYFPRNPDFAVYQGRHEFDGKLPDW